MAGGTASGRLRFGGIGGGAGDGGRKGGGKKGPPEGGQGFFKYDAPDVKKGKQSALQLFFVCITAFMTWIMDINLANRLVDHMADVLENNFLQFADVVQPFAVARVHCRRQARTSFSALR
ncbi:hypothetical protein EJ02DRAFT_438072 [Clathrospora elynae]|uniref:Uncharacterized protein n=1 Tax=Clathrospora elynae TaxID=706981 RepID=A0A6A5S8X9_9PLEO|nr:hypothetical protein EJ02DRAFT_438072 [Clathrospora elynae]